MRRVMHSRRTVIPIALTLVLSACGKKDQSVVADSGMATSSTTPATASVEVADVDLGRKIGTDKKITDKTDTFAPKDQIYASVHTTGSSPASKLDAKWTFENGTVVNEKSESIAPAGDTYTEFHIAKPSGWPKGKYTLHVLLDGQEVKTADFTVK